MTRVEPGDSPLARATGEHCSNEVMGRLTLWTGGNVDVDLGGEEENETALNCFAYSYGAQWNTDFTVDRTNQEQWKAMAILIKWRIIKFADLTGIMELIRAMWLGSIDGHGGPQHLGEWLAGSWRIRETPVGKERMVETWTTESWDGETAEVTTMSNLHLWGDATVESKNLVMRIGSALLRIVMVWTQMGDGATHRNGRLQLLQASVMEIDGIAWKARGRITLEAADLLTKLALRMEEAKRLDTVMDEVMHNLEERVKEGMIDEERSELWKARARTATFQRRLGMATNAMVASQWPTENSMTVQDGMQRTLTEYAQTAAAIVMKAVTALKRGANSEEDTRAIDDCYEHMDDIIGELGGELVHWTDWYESAADALQRRGGSRDCGGERKGKSEHGGRRGERKGEDGGSQEAGSTQTRGDGGKGETDAEHHILHKE